MGLSGRKDRQRIGNDPRNLSWADDAARFGANYLTKFGWDPSKGLGASADGMKSHLKVSQKLDMLGIGAAHRLDPNGIAWKQNKDFENLLKRLNGDVGEAVVDGFKKTDSSDEEQKEKKRKRKHDSQEAPEKKRKKMDEEKEDPRGSESTNLPSEMNSSSSKPVPRHRAHRARAIAAKNLSSKSAAHISEILGIAPTPTSLSTTTTSSGLTSGVGTPQDGDPTSNTLEKITTSTKSLHDYFKERLKTKKSSIFLDSSAITLEDTDRDTSCDIPRAGLGSNSSTAFGSRNLSFSSLNASRPRDSRSLTEVAAETQAVDKSTVTPGTEHKIKRKKRSKIANELQEDTLVSDNDARSKVRKIIAIKEDPSAKKKGGKRKQDKRIRDDMD